MIILVINCGSSSIKYQLIEMPALRILSKGIIERIGKPDSVCTYSNKEGKTKTIYKHIESNSRGIDVIISHLTHANGGALSELYPIEAVGHRVAHGGEKYRNSILLREEDIIELESLNELAPLHNPPALEAIQSVSKILPQIKQVAVFDTSYHQTIPEYAYLYPLPYSFYKDFHIRRYGFHGHSHSYVSREACKELGVDLVHQKIISCHLGNGSSIAAIAGGESIDTSMGFTPLEGLMMGSRTGDIDAGVVTYLIKKLGIGPEELEEILYKQSGLLGITGISSDVRDVEKEVPTNSMAELGLDMYCYRIKKYIGAYFAAMNGLDILIFTGGIGENDPFLRKKICENLDSLGIKVDRKRNESSLLISSHDSRVSVMVVPTFEELIIAEETYRLVV